MGKFGLSLETQSGKKINDQGLVVFLFLFSVVIKSLRYVYIMNGQG